MSIRTLCHASAHDFSPAVGDVIILRPGKQNAQGIGVYFSEGAPDVRASDSCLLAGGVKTQFWVEVEATRTGVWWYSKGCRDKAKGRPKTWHSNGRCVKITIDAIDGINVYGRGELVSDSDR